MLITLGYLRKFNAWLWIVTDYRSLDRVDRWVTVFDVATREISFHVLRSCDSLFNSSDVFPVQVLMLSSHEVLGPPLLLPPSTEPCMITLASPVEWLTWPNNRIFLLFTAVSRCSWGPADSVIFAQTDSLVWCAAYGILRILHKHRNLNACRRRSVSAVNVLDSQPYNAVDIVIAFISLILDG